MLKRLLSLSFLCSLCLLLFFGCGGSETADSTDSTPQLPQATYSVQVSWTIPAEREDHSLLPADEIDYYEVIYTRLDDDISETMVVDDPQTTSVIIEDLLEGDYEFYALTVDMNGLRSRSSETISITIGG